MNSDLFWSRAQMLKQLGCGDRTLQELTRRQDNPLPSMAVGRRILYPKSRVAKWVAGNPTMPVPLRMVS